RRRQREPNEADAQSKMSHAALLRVLTVGPPVVRRRMAKRGLHNKRLRQAFLTAPEAATVLGCNSVIVHATPPASQTNNSGKTSQPVRRSFACLGWGLGGEYREEESTESSGRESCMTDQITVTLPTEVLRRAEQLARCTGRSTDQLLAEMIELSLQPLGTS